MLSLRSLLTSLFFCAVAVRVGHAQSGDNYCINPPASGPYNDFSENPTYTTFNDLVLQWTTTYKRLDLVLWQPAVDGSYQNIFTNRSSSTGFYSWIIDADQFDLSGSNTTSGIPNNVFYFYFYPNPAESNENGFTSHYFNLNSSSNSLGSAPTTTYTSASIPTTTATSSPSSNIVNNPGSDGGYSYEASTGLTEDQKLGLGLGIGLGVPLIVSIAAACYLLGRDHSRSGEDTGATAARSGSRPPFSGAAAARSSQAATIPMEQRPGYTEHYAPQIGAGEPAGSNVTNSQGTTQAAVSSQGQEGQATGSPFTTAKYH